MVVSDVGVLTLISVDAGCSLILAFHLGQLSIFVCDVDHHLLALSGNLLCALPVVHLPRLHSLGLPLVSPALLLSFLFLQRFELLGLSVVLLCKSCLLLSITKDLHKSLFTNHLHSLS
jgi:hypothetical protein